MEKINFKLLIAVVMMVAVNSASACINGASLYLKNNLMLYQHEEGRVPEGHKFPDATKLRIGIRELDSLYHLTGDIDYLSDKGVILIVLGRYADAINLYLNIEKNNPARYATASNIGTAYELAGQNRNALLWLRKAVQISPDSHYHSEWIHVNILEGKVKNTSSYTSYDEL